MKLEMHLLVQMEEKWNEFWLGSNASLKWWFGSFRDQNWPQKKRMQKVRGTTCPASNSNARKDGHMRREQRWKMRSWSLPRSILFGLSGWHSGQESCWRWAVQHSMPEWRNSSAGSEVGHGEESPPRFNRWSTREFESSAVRSMGSRGSADQAASSDTWCHGDTGLRSFMEDVRGGICRLSLLGHPVPAAFVLLDYLLYNLEHCRSGVIGRWDSVWHCRTTRKETWSVNHLQNSFLRLKSYILPEWCNW